MKYVLTKVVTKMREVHGVDFGDSKGILLIEYLEKGKQITGEYYYNLLTKLDEIIGGKGPGFPEKNYFLTAPAAWRKKSRGICTKKFRKYALYSLVFHLVRNPNTFCLGNIFRSIQM